mmetsp:Transcript_138920/g.443202  ORF Transcript_138920/g.443202 Transcript_138920/m.443202 type:complete len:213 (+) Transcript_138920:739-1377(+)
MAKQSSPNHLCKSSKPTFCTLSIVSGTWVSPSMRWLVLKVEGVQDLKDLGVVLAVRILPPEVRHQHERVQHPTDGIIERPVGGEATMATLVRQDPPADGRGALREAVDSPTDPLPQGQGLGGEPGRAQHPRREHEDAGHDQGIPEHQEQGVGDGMLEALLGDGSPDLRNRRHLRRLCRSSGFPFTLLFYTRIMWASRPPRHLSGLRAGAAHC